MEQTLAFNLEQVAEQDHFAIADLGSNDGLEDYMFSNFQNEMAKGKVLYFKVENAVRWSSPIAKNLAHRLSPAPYLMNLDADNFVTRSDREIIASCAFRNQSCHQFSGTYGDGTYGRIGLSSVLFYKLGGYDEGMLPMGAQDENLLKRINHYDNIGAPELPALDNINASHDGYNVKDKLKDERYKAMNRFNSRLGNLRVKYEGAEILGGFRSFSGKLNGSSAQINGLDTIEDLKARYSAIGLANLICKPNDAPTFATTN